MSTLSIFPLLNRNANGFVTPKTETLQFGLRTVSFNLVGYRPTAQHQLPLGARYMPKLAAKKFNFGADGTTGVERKEPRSVQSEACRPKTIFAYV
jgi:hypothetical protein